jgi:hypothetical protein
MKFILATLLLLLQTTTYASSDYGAWAKKNTDGSWTLAAKNAVSASKLASSEPKDINNFCPGYAHKIKEEREVFWVGLLSIIARPESNFKPETTYTESFIDGSGKKVISRGLLQISIESANQKKYNCQIAKPEDLHNPAVNIACGVKILDAWVQTDDVVATYGNSAAKGGGRYWSTLREAKKHLPELTKFTKSLAVCQNAL